ncbi:MAG: GntR family transcriptional regulator [bacterium]|nr:GntR family transcriptional regulator [bacterium]
MEVNIQLNSVTPLYQQVKNDLLNKIENGTYPKGDLIPKEADLEKFYGVSRITIRNAIKELVEDNFLVRKQGKGTFVAQAKVNSDISEQYGFSQLCIAMGMQPESKILEKKSIPALPRDIQTFHLQDKDSMIYIHRLRIANDTPILLEENYLPPAYSFLLDIDMENRSLYKILAERSTFNANEAYSFTTTVEAASATRYESRMLNISSGSPVFIVKELVIDTNGSPIHRTKQTINGKLYRFEFHKEHPTPSFISIP